MATVECLCQPKPAGEVRHPDGDTITLRDKLDFVAGRTARNIVKVMRFEDPGVDNMHVAAAVTEFLITVGIASWTVVDAKGKPVEPNRDNIETYLMSNDMAADDVADEIDSKFMEAVLAPLAGGASKSSPAMPTSKSTSATNGSSSKPPKQSKPSSTTTSQMDGIETTSLSLVGASS